MQSAQDKELRPVQCNGASSFLVQRALTIELIRTEMTCLCPISTFDHHRMISCGHFAREYTGSNAIHTDLGLSKSACHHSSQMNKAYPVLQLVSGYNAKLSTHTRFRRSICKLAIGTTFHDTRYGCNVDHARAVTWGCFAAFGK
jgi:hypothetical protein